MYDIKKDLKARIERTKKLLERLEETQRFAESGQYFFRVTLMSAWSDYGEQNAVGTGPTPEAAMENAEQEFKKINNRSDVQASHRTTVVVFPNDFKFQPHEIH